MPLITVHSSIFNIVVQTSGYTAQVSNSFGNVDLDLLSVTNESSISESVSGAAFNSITKITTGFNTYYKMQGFNTSTQQYENWHSMGTPLLSPPSGNVLTNISVVHTWQDR